MWCSASALRFVVFLEMGWRRAQLTPSRLSPSSRWRGMTVTISISQRKAVSKGVRPGGRSKAMVEQDVVRLAPAPAWREIVVTQSRWKMVLCSPKGLDLKLAPILSN